MLEITDSMMRQPSSVRVALSQLSALSLLSLESASLRDAKMRVGAVVGPQTAVWGLLHVGRKPCPKGQAD